MNYLNQYFQNKKVLITGHTGFKGSWLSIWLTYLGAKVIGVSNNISIDCGIIVFDAELNVSRFVQLPYSIGQIHHIMCA